MRIARPKLTYANVMSSIAVFLAAGGGAYAAVTLPHNSVGSAQLKANSVTSAKVRDGSLLPRDFKAGSLKAGATGPAGARGATGAKGDAGPKGATGSKGATGTQGSAGPAGAGGSNTVFTNYGQNHTIGQGLTQTVASVTLPPGRYTLSATAVFSEVDGDGKNAALSCSFVSAATVHQVAIGGGGYVGAYGVTNPTETMPVIGDATVTTNNTSVFLRCKSVLQTAGVSAAMIATQVGTITPSS
jgi:Collagen triple helix repeat (20 copies)